VTAVLALPAAERRAESWWRPRWQVLAGLLILTGCLYLAGLTRNGWANDFYAAAVQAGTKSWKAFFFGSFDASNGITVDKTPGSLWVMELSARLFGFSQWSVLIPQAIEGVLSVWVLYAAVRRWFGTGAGLVAGLVLALTPVAVLMFSYNNPDSLLVLLMLLAAYALVRAVENGRTRWLVLCGVLLGFAFLAKMLQAFLVLPGFGVAYLWAGPPRLFKRVWQLLLGAFGVVVGAGWWVLAAQLTPAADRPYFGGSTDNSILQLALGYNGLGRLDGNETGSVGPGSDWGGAASVLRLFRSEFGGQISWLMPAALLVLVCMLWASRRAVRTDRVRAAALLWGGWLLVTGGVFSYMNGIIHPYYMVALAPGIAALIGIGAMSLWSSGLHQVGSHHAGSHQGGPHQGGPDQVGMSWTGRSAVAAGVLGTAVWAWVLLERSPDWLPWLRWAVVIAGVLGAGVILGFGFGLRFGLGLGSWRRLGPWSVAGVLGLALVAGLGGPTAYALNTINSAHTGAIPSAGPATAAGGGFGGGFGGAGGGGFGGRGGGGGSGHFGGGTGTGSGTGFTGRPAGSGTGGFPGGAGSAAGTSGANGTGTGTGTGTGSTATGSTGGGTRAGRGGGQFGNGFRPGGGTGRAAGSGGGAGGFGAGGRGFGGFGGGGGSLGGSTTVSGALTTLLKQDASHYTWVAATEGSEAAAPLELATGDAVVAIGGFNGTDPWPTLALFEEMVATHEIHYYVGASGASFGGGAISAQIATWVADHFKKQTVGGETIYDLTQPATSSSSA
jgi:4-amino-4-deoxy-L-arabinose transferase-like glycosyltransferase